MPVMTRESELTKDYLIKRYLEDQASTLEIAKEIGCSTATVPRYLRKHGIPIRSKGAAPVDWRGRRFGRLVVVEDMGCPKARRSRHWRCVCDCGGEITVNQHYLKVGDTRSCGCYIKSVCHLRQWIGLKYVPSNMWSRIRLGADERGIEFDITLEYVESLYEAQDKKCALTGQPIHFERHHIGHSTASLDRIDSFKGYVEGNVQWVHKAANLAKHRLSQEAFLELAEMVVKTLGPKLKPTEHPPEPEPPTSDVPPKFVLVAGDDGRWKNQLRGLYVDGELVYEGEVTLDQLAKAAGLDFRYSSANADWLAEQSNLPLKLADVESRPL